MDHLPSLGASDAVQIPCLCPEGYDGGDFRTYYRRCGWPDKSLVGELGERSTEQYAAFLQAWMYFGFLYDFFQPILGDDFKQEDFIREVEPSQKFITTRKLGEYAIEVWNREKLASPSRRQEIFKRMKNCIEWVHQLSNHYALANGANRQAESSRWPLSPVISLSILVLGDTLQHIGFMVTGLPFNRDWGVGWLLLDKMRKAGWCPNTYLPLAVGQNVQMLWYATTLGGPRLKQDHEECSEAACRWEQPPYSESSMQHRPDCQGCRLLETPMDKLIWILEKEGIPLITCYKENGSLQLDIIEHIPNSVHAGQGISDYTAISHVWSEGLGNDKANALYSCQVIWLQSLVNEVELSRQGDKTGFWWCDTLCVPVHPEHKAHRKNTIRQMARIYRDAAKVLVLDDALMQISRYSPAAELFLRLMLSRWMRRLWTLQEGVLARDAFVQFCDGTKTLIDLSKAIWQEGQLDHQCLYRRYIHLSITFFGLYEKGAERNMNVRFRRVLTSLLRRSTSYQRDETICLATLFNLDPGPILEIAETDFEGRMIKFLQMLKTIPPILLYQPPPRLSQAGFKWAPSSFLVQFQKTRLNPYGISDDTAEIGPDGKGLRIKRPGFRLGGEGPQDHLVSVFGELRRGTHFQTSPPTDTARSQCFYLVLTYSLLDGDVQKKVPKRPVVILDKATLVQTGSPSAILADVREVEPTEKCIEVDYIAPVHLRWESLENFPTANATVVDAQKYPDNQEWILY